MYYPFWRHLYYTGYCQQGEIGRTDGSCPCRSYRGLNSREIAVDFIKNNTEADGIISTKPALIRRGRELSLFTVMRYFLIDSMALENVRSQQSGVRPDVIEILPGLMPEIIRKISQTSRIPIIAGGLITDKKSVMAALSPVQFVYHLQIRMYG